MPELLLGGTLAYHNIDPILFEWGFVVIRWYSLAYIGGLLFAWWYLSKLSDDKDSPTHRYDIEEYFMWATFGVILGGRIGYVLFYNFDYYLANPGAILRLWDGGMSFHGGFVGVVVASYIFASKRGISKLAFGDRLAVASPIGLMLGRISNFINGELWGAPSQLPWAMPFPSGGPEPRHPSQLYEALGEGLLLFLILNYLLRRTSAREYPGMIMGTFILGYGFVRYLIEFVRMPDAHIGKIGGIISMGQILSLPMILVGLYFIIRAIKKGPQKIKKRRATT
jgi:phosphatidylglycerol---prolipoprotein diacylglyceryl transferase